MWARAWPRYVSRKASQRGPVPVAAWWPSSQRASIRSRGASRRSPQHPRVRVLVVRVEEARPERGAVVLEARHGDLGRERLHVPLVQVQVSGLLRGPPVVPEPPGLRQGRARRLLDLGQFPVQSVHDAQRQRPSPGQIRFRHADRDAPATLPVRPVLEKRA
jgi:hypothetical protein